MINNPIKASRGCVKMLFRKTIRLIMMKTSGTTG